MRATILDMKRTLFLFLVLTMAASTTMAYDDEASLEKTARDLLSNFVAGHFEAATKEFDEKMMAALPPPKLAEVAKQLEPQLGKFKQVKEAKHGTVQGYKVVTLLSEYENGLVNVQVTFDPDGKVAGLYFRPPE